MMRPAESETYLWVRRWVDHDLANQRRPTSIFGPLFFMLFAMIAADWAGGVFFVTGWSVIVPIFAAWMAFVCWRLIRLLRAMTIKGDREFDQRGKYLLPPEYAASESYLAHQKRRNRLRRLMIRR